MSATFLLIIVGLESITVGPMRDSRRFPPTNFWWVVKRERKKALGGTTGGGHSQASPGYEKTGGGRRIWAGNVAGVRETPAKGDESNAPESGKAAYSDAAADAAANVAAGGAVSEERNEGVGNQYGIVGAGASGW